MHTYKNQDGITLLITLLLMGVLLGVSASLLNVTLKQYQLAGIAYESEIAFQAASAGVECVLYNDHINHEFDFGTRDDISCFSSIVSNDLAVDGDGTSASSEEQRFQFSWGNNPEVCTDVSIYKFFNATVDVDIILPDGTNMRPSRPCPANGTCTVLQSRGYNVACASIQTGARVIEREYTQVY
jgi:hypothetical protein